MAISVDATTVLSSAITALIISGVTLVGNRYLSRILDRIEREMARKDDRNGGNGKDKAKTS